MKLVGSADGGWPNQNDIAVTVQKGNGFGAAAQGGIDHLIVNGT